MADAAGAVPHVQGIAFPAQDLLVTSAIDGTMVRWNLTDDSSESSIEAPPTFTMGTVLARTTGLTRRTAQARP
jgi:hypothetical protein